MKTSQTRELRVLQAGNHAEHLGLRAVLHLGLEAHDIVEGAKRVVLAKLDHQFPSDHCGMCRMLPVVGREYASQYCMRKSLFHDNIKILPFTDVESIEGEAGVGYVLRPGYDLPPLMFTEQEIVLVQSAIAHHSDKAGTHGRFEELLKKPPEIKPEDNPDLWR